MKPVEEAQKAWIAHCQKSNVKQAMACLNLDAIHKAYLKVHWMLEWIRSHYDEVPNKQRRRKK